MIKQYISLYSAEVFSKYKAHGEDGEGAYFSYVTEPADPGNAVVRKNSKPDTGV